MQQCLLLSLIKYLYLRKNKRCIQIIEEFGEFVLARLFSMVFKQIRLYVCIEYLRVSEYNLFGITGLMIAKIVLSFVAVLLNYIARKWIIFTSKEY